MTASQLRRQLAKIQPPAEPVAMLRQVNEVWPNNDLAALPAALDSPGLVKHFLRDEFLKDRGLFQGSGIELPEEPDSIFSFRVRPRSFGYLCEVSFVAGPMCGSGAEFQFSQAGLLDSEKAVSLWIS